MDGHRPDISPETEVLLRELAKKPKTAITRQELAKLFHMPISAVARELGMCETMLKKICRSLGVVRWPHRKIASLKGMIKELETSLATEEMSDDMRTIRTEELAVTRSKLRCLLEDPNACVDVTPYHRSGTNSQAVSPPTHGSKPKQTDSVPASLAAAASAPSSSSSPLQLIADTPSPPASPTSSLSSKPESRYCKPHGKARDMYSPFPLVPQSPTTLPLAVPVATSIFSPIQSTLPSPTMSSPSSILASPMTSSVSVLSAMAPAATTTATAAALPSFPWASMAAHSGALPPLNLPSIAIPRAEEQRVIDFHEWSSRNVVAPLATPLTRFLDDPKAVLPDGQPLRLVFNSSVSQQFSDR